MAIDPTTTTTVKVSELASAGYNTTDLIPHEVAGILKKGNLQDLATFIGGIISTEGAVGFRAVQVNDGETLPATDEQEFILVGPGTYPNVGGGPTITTTEPLNALVSNATYWFIGVEIPITATGVWGTITGVLSDQTDLNDVLDVKADLVDGKVPNSQLPSYVDDVVEVANYAALPATGETGKIYVTIDNGNVYRWSGSAYIRIADESPVWGIITGTLSDQTDLQNALDGKFDVPTGDTTQYIAGDGSLITFPVAGQAGTLVRLVRNNSGATITKGTVVYINGASGNNPTIAKAIATGDSTSAQTFGLVQANITNNSNGYVVVIGDLIGVNTSAIAEGSQLYLSSTTAGEYTTTKQLAPAHLVYIGVVTRSHATLGQIEVKIQNGYELDELHDVAISSKANNEVIVYESSTDLWKNKSIATILGYTPANDASVVKLTGDQSITGSKSFTTNTTAPAMIVTNNSTDNGILLQNTSTGNALRINNGALSTGDLIRAGKDGNVTFIVNQNGTTTAASFIKSGGTSSQFLKADGSVDSSTYSLDNAVVHLTGNETISGVKTLQNTLNLTAGVNIDDAYGFYWKTNVGEIETALAGIGQSSSGLNFFTGSSFISPRMFINSSGNVGIGTTSPAEKLEVQNGTSGAKIKVSNTGGGYAMLECSSNATSTATLSFTNSLALTGGNVGIGTTSPTTKLQVSGGNFTISNTTSPRSIVSGNTSNGFPGYMLSNTTQEYEIIVRGNLSNSFQIRNSTASTDLMTITSGGNVGIGTTSPANKLEVSTSGTSLASFTGAEYSQFNIIGGTQNFYIQNYNSVSILGTKGASPLLFTTNETERMRITSGGSVLVNLTSTSAYLDGKFNSFGNSTIPAACFKTESSGQFTTSFWNAASGTVTLQQFVHGTGQSLVGSISSNGSTTSYNITSDYRLKEDLKSINGLDLISKIKIYDFKFKNSDFRMGGVIAHELQEVVPYAVTGEKDAEQMQSVDYSKLVPILVQAIQELKAEIEILKNK